MWKWSKHKNDEKNAKRNVKKWKRNNVKTKIFENGQNAKVKNSKKAKN